MKLSEFRNANKQFRWNYDKPLETHRNFPASSCFPLHWAGHIGRTDTALVYACNTEEKLHGFKDTVAVKLIDIEKKKHGQRKKAEDECKNLRAVSHHHIIAYLGSFTYMRDFGIVMFPVAEFHLGDLLRIVSEDNKSRRQDDARPPHAYLELLKSYFGCLCRALMHLHHRDDPIKHKDIKPANILVDRYKNIILTDFGISKHYENKLAARTTGDTHHTVMYAPPEVFNSNDYRDLDSDIFSLGCVFLEMATVILGRTLKDLYRHLEEDVQETVHTEDDSTSQGIICYARNLAKVDQWIEELRTRCQRLSDVSQCQESGSLSDATLQTIRRMMSSKQDERPGLAELWTDFKGLSKNCTSCMEEADRHAAASNVPDIAITAEIADKREETQSSLDRLEGVQEEVSALTPPLPPPELESQIVEEMPALDLADIRLAKNDSQSSQASEAIASAGRPSGDVRPVSWEGSSTTEVAAAQGPTGAPTETGADVSDNPTRDIVEREVALSSALEKTPASPIAGEAEDNDRLSESTAEDSRKQISTNAPVFRRTPMVTFVDPQPETELTPRGGSASARSSDTAQDSEDRVSSDQSRNDENIEGVETIPGHMRGPPYHQAAHSVGPEILQKLPAQSDNEGTVPSKKKTYTITVFDWQRGSWKLDHYRDVPGKMVVVFNDGNKLLETVPKDRVDCELHDDTPLRTLLIFKRDSPSFVDATSAYGRMEVQNSRRRPRSVEAATTSSQHQTNLWLNANVAFRKGVSDGPAHGEHYA